ncbi:MAG: hypothetical protein M3O32_10835 [Actinomycetota bacterium]|nr:hypothetical protein [Actinomycetota bacterium]
MSVFDSTLRLGPVLRSLYTEQHQFMGFQARSVPIGLNRSPDVWETRSIEGPLARARLISAGYDGVSLRVESTRLEVDGTTVAEIDEQLFTVLSDVIEDSNVLNER